MHIRLEAEPVLSRNCGVMRSRAASGWQRIAEISAARDEILSGEVSWFTLFALSSGWRSESECGGGRTGFLRKPSGSRGQAHNVQAVSTAAFKAGVNLHLVRAAETEGANKKR
jgi:hypothetical protein